ncbi:hypothetical protein QLS71_011425 [Mariniflexile litorale]|uniref:Uncharacterized protein n=1 Tax=Mariniflexile litorale TaxID=3045158 RepID=A0AAU7ECT3_9FLAO|nr:hypothetical protein [Mariniflexile sp. KMM 9835]MDQ8212960.1 hypothetical protein [Mariniflexile sp. KMM 9835]
MKQKLILLIFITFFFALNLSCDTNDSSKTKSIAAYKSSLSAWNTLKETHGNSYKYTITSGSVFGFGSNTTITVINGTVTSRIYEAYSIYDDNNNYVGYENRVVFESYTENIKTLNSHDSGAAAVIIDALYDTCLSKYLSVDADSNSITFNVDDNNLIKNCYHIPNGCQDDCTFGIQISSFEWLTIAS